MTRVLICTPTYYLQGGVERIMESLAHDILRFCRERLAPYKRIRCIEFAELPKTISGKIKRNELRAREADARARGIRQDMEFFEDERRPEHDEQALPRRHEV